MTLQTAIPTTLGMQRAQGQIVVETAHDPARGSFLKTLRQEGSYRAVFPRVTAQKMQDRAVAAVMVNTAGGVTGGDHFKTAFQAHQNARLTVTTQAAERIYRASGNDAGEMTNRLRVATNASLFWLPQETILFDGCGLLRRLRVDLEADATFLMVEPLVFGRTASGEAVHAGHFQDHVTIHMDGAPIYLDRVNMTGDITATLGRPAVANGATAMASLVFVDRDAKDRLAACRALLPDTAGASLLRDDVLVARFLAPDSFALRTALLPILKLLTDNAVPKNWKL